MASAGVDDFSFDIVGGGKRDLAFQGYDSASDPTIVDVRYMIKGSQNVYLTNRGTIAVRPGLKLFGDIDGTEDGVTSSYEFETSTGMSLPLRVLQSGKLQFLYQGTWYLLDTAVNNTDYSWTTWWDNENKTTLLVFVRNDANIYSWSGAISPAVGTISDTGLLIGGGGGAFESIVTSMVAGVITGQDRIEAANNYVENIIERSSLRSAFVLKDNPVDGDLIQLSIVTPSPFKSGTVSVVFLNNISAVGPDPAIGYVLIGANKEATIANLISFFQSPGTTTGTQVGVTSTDLITALGYESSYVQVNSLSTGGTMTWPELGFTNGYPSVGSSIEVDGISYPYTLVSDTYLIHISGTPTAGDIGYQSIQTAVNTPDADFTSDWCISLRNQLIVGSGTSRIVYISSDDNFSDFTNSGDVVPGDPDFVILDEFPVGGIVKGDSAYIAAGDSSWYVVTPNTPIAAFPGTVITTVEKQVGAVKSAAFGHNFIATIGEDIVYLSKDHQLRTLGTLRNIVTPKTPSLSKAVRQELLDEDFTGGALRVVTDQDEFVYITAPISGRDYLYQIRDDVDDVGNLTATRLWQPPQVRNLSRIAIIDGVVLGYSAEFPQLYQLWATNQWHDDTPDGPAPYTKVLRMAYRQFSDKRCELGSFDKVYYEGYILDRSGLTALIYNEYQGATAIQTYVLSDDDGSAVLYGSDGVILIGGKIVGNETIGGGLPDPTYEIDIPKFRVIQNVIQHDCFEYSLELNDSQADSRWEILALGPDMSTSENNPVQLQKND